MPEPCSTSRFDQRARAGFPAVASLTCLGYLNALGFAGLCDPADDTPLTLDRQRGPRPVRGSRAAPR